MKDLSLGIDTSNYKTSVAVVNKDGELLFNHQQLLDVKKGERGLRQSTALFQHVQNLPPVLETLFNENREMCERIGAVSVSEKPRPVEGSYMPVFTAGMGFARTLAASLNVPLFKFSHQEGHIEAIKFYSALKDVTPLVCFHFSGGTTEAILVNDEEYKLVGGSKDISYGQVLDRIGVAMGMEFPCGAQLDEIALKNMGEKYPAIFTPVKVKDGFVNLSGIETQGQRFIGQYDNEAVIGDLFKNISRSILKMTLQISEEYDIKNFIFAGGVSGSKYVQKYLSDELTNKHFNAVFGHHQYTSDNAIGTALLGGKQIWL